MPIAIVNTIIFLVNTAEIHGVSEHNWDKQDFRKEIKDQESCGFIEPTLAEVLDGVTR